MIQRQPSRQFSTSSSNSSSGALSDDRTSAVTAQAQAKQALGAAQLTLAHAMYRVKVLERMPASDAEREQATHAFRAAMAELQDAWVRWQSLRQTNASIADHLLTEALGANWPGLAA